MKIQTIFLTCTIPFLLLFTLSACSTSSINWIPGPGEEQRSFQVLGPIYIDETIEPYRNIKLLNQAITEVVDQLKKDQNLSKSGRYSKLAISNWVLKENQVSELWKLFETSKEEKGLLLAEPGLQTRLVNYFEELEFSGRILAVRFSPVDQNETKALEGVRVIYLSENEIDFNRFRIPVDQEQSELLPEFKKTIRKLLTSLEYSSPSFQWMGFSKVESGCLLTGQDRHDEECLDDFYLGRFPVTKQQWNGIMLPLNSQSREDAQFPAVGMNWSEIQLFIEKLNDEFDQTYRLPTGYEWEYACRAGTNNLVFGTETGDLDSTQANYTIFEKGNKPKGITEIDAFAANGLGLHDMSGNTWEWTEDPYKTSEEKGLIGAFFDFLTSNQNRRVMRGGSYDSSAEDLKCNSEKYIPEHIGSSDAGIRLVLEE